jgi:hypothetical protein
MRTIFKTLVHLHTYFARSIVEPLTEFFTKIRVWLKLKIMCRFFSLFVTFFHVLFSAVSLNTKRLEFKQYNWPSPLHHRSWKLHTCDMHSIQTSFPAVINSDVFFKQRSLWESVMHVEKNSVGCLYRQEVNQCHTIQCTTFPS